MIEGLRRPDRLAVLRVEGDDAAIERSNDDLAFPHGEAPRHRLAAGIAAIFARRPGIIGPQTLAGTRIIGRGDVPGQRVVEHPIGIKRRRFDAAHGVELIIPGNAELVHIGRVDLRERRITLGVIAAAVMQPVGAVRGLFRHAGAVDRRRPRPVSAVAASDTVITATSAALRNQFIMLSFLGRLCDRLRSVDQPAGPRAISSAPPIRADRHRRRLRPCPA